MAADGERLLAQASATLRGVEVLARLDAQGRYLYVHPVFTGLAGVSPADLVGREIGATVPDAAVVSGWERAVREVLQTGGERSLTPSAQVAGRSLDMEILVLPERGPAGEVLSVTAIGRDMTEHRGLLRRLEDQRRQIEKRVRELTALHDIATLLQTHAGDPHDVMAQVVERIPGAMTKPGLAVACVRVDGRFHVSARFRETQWTLAAPIRSESGAALGSLAVCYLEDPADPEPFEVEERRLIETVASHISASFGRAMALRELATSEAYFRALIESSSDAVSVATQDGTRLYLSPPFERLLGYRPAEVLGRSIFELVHPDDGERSHRLFHRILQEGAGRDELRFVHRDGSIRHVEILGRNLVDDPNVGGVVSSLRDVSERRELSRQLVQSQKMEAVGRLAGGVAHDFNNLLTVIDVNAEMLLRRMAAQDRGREEVQQVLEASRRGAALTRQLLAFSRRDVAQPKALDLRSVIRGMQSMLARIIGEDVVLQTEVETEPCTVRADSGQLEQILLNLAVNARDAMPRGGSLRIRCARSGQQARLEVEDDGEGMPPEVIERIFEPFFTTRDAGTGLGLSTVYGLVQQASGHIDVDSAPGRGAKFVIRLPLCEGLPAPSEPDDEDAELPTGDETVLVVEDEPGVRRLLRELLGRLGYRVVEAADGAEALRRARRHRGDIDLVLSDVVMPGMSGPQTVAALRDEGLTDAPALFMSGHADDAQLRHGVREQRVQLIDKPFSSATVARLVRDLLDGEQDRSQ